MDAMASTPAPVPGDDKNWTWVLEARCPECGFDGRTVAVADVAPMLRAANAAWVTVLAEDADWLRARPEPTVWSPLEYACHVRDVLRLYDTRLGWMIADDGVEFPNWDQDATAVELAYHLDDPAPVSEAISTDGARLADHFDTVQDDQWQRRGTRSDGAVFTIETFARYFLHDPIHHLADVGRPFPI